MMKKSIITKAMILAFGLFAASCSEETGGFGSGTGRIAPLVGCDGDVEGMGQTLSRAGDEITVDDLSLTLSKDDGSYRHTWEKVSDFDVEKQFSVGNYTLTAFYGDPEAEGYEMPAYSGTVPVRVSDGQTSRVSLTATVVNSKITVVFTDEFKKYMNDYIGQFVTTKGTHEYGKDEVRPLYIAPGSATFNVHVVKPNGQEANFEVAKINAQARHHYVITVNVNGGNVSDAVLEVNFDDTLDQEPVTIDLSDEIMGKPAPTIATEGFEVGTPVELIAGVKNTAKAQFHITALAGFKSVTLTTESAYLIANGWPETIDLLAATDAEQNILTGKGLVVAGLWKNPETMALLDFAPVAEYLTAGTARFTVSATDLLGRTVEKPVSVELKLSEPEFEIANIEGQYFSDEMPVSFALSANIPLEEANLKVEYKNKRGTTSEAKIVDFKEGIARSASYTITIQTPSDIEDKLVVKLICGRVGSNELSLLASPYSLDITENDVFATHAFMGISTTAGTAAPALKDVQLFFRNADGSLTATTAATASGYFDLTGLSADTDYTVRAKIGNVYTKARTFHTEKILQLPNSGMEEWSYDKGSNYWGIDYPSADKNNMVWDTMNRLSTSEGSSAATAVGSGYAAKSGTTPVDDSRSGKAAMIHTVGWGKGNTAWLNKIGSGATGGKCEHLTVGELYLGHYDASAKVAVYDGFAFASRPSVLKFWAKYQPKNSADWGTAEIRMLAADGSVITSKDLNISKTDSYTQFSIPLTYTRGMQKAAKIIVIFKSSGNSVCQVINNDNLDSPPSSQTLTSKGYTGSKLYVDDIELTY